MSALEVVKPKLYLDVDGVILPLARPGDASLPFEMRPANSLEYYSPEVVSRLGNTCLKLVWCTTWESNALKELVESMDALRGGSKLDLPTTVEGVSRISQKLDAIIADQKENPSPFVWVDDAITKEELLRLSETFGNIAHLIVQPEKALGIDNGQLSVIEAFARAQYR